MAEYYAQQEVVLVGSKSSAGSLTKVALTDAYDVANKTKIFETGGFNTCAINVVYTTGGSETNNILHTRIEASYDGTNFFQLTNESASSGTSTIYQRELQFTGASAATAYTFSYLLDIGYKKMRFSFKESGVASNAGTVYAEAILA